MLEILNGIFELLLMLLTHFLLQVSLRVVFLIQLELFIVAMLLSVLNSFDTFLHSLHVRFL